MTPANWQQIKTILDEALSHSPQARASFLDTACLDDDFLRREVESLLAFEGEEADIIGDSAFNLPELGSFCRLAENFVGKQIGHYKITEELGAGGMGAVFLAVRDDGEFEQQVAVKLIKQGITSNDGLRRFYLERRILARLEHPNIARLIDGGTTENGLPYFVLEYVEGLPINEYAAKNTLSLIERLDLFREVCAAVSYAHRNLIVHRDLKPSNILIGGDGEPKLLDFGIAKILKIERANETRTQTFMLTPEYASPEQLRGETLTTATDIYSLGVILYELLTGARPFAFDGKNIGDIIQSVSLTEPMRPSSVGNRPKSKVQSPKPEDPNENPKTKIQNLKSLKGDLDNIILKALKKEPERRYLSVEQFSEDIRRHLKGLPVFARNDTLRYRAEKFARRNPLVVGAIMLAFLILIGGIVAVGWQARIANAERAKAERRFKDVRSLADSFMFEINEQIEKSPIKARELLVSRALEYLDKLAREAEGDDDLQSDLATAYEKIGDVQSELFKPSLGKISGSLESHRKSLKIRESLFAASPNDLQRGLDLAGSRNRVGDALTTTGKQMEAVENYRESARLFERLAALEPKNVGVQSGLAKTYAKLGQAILRSGSLSESLKNYEKALTIQKNLTAENPADPQIQHGVSRYSSYIGYVKMEMGAGEESEHFFRNALEIDEKIFAADKFNAQLKRFLSIDYLWVGYALREIGKPDESLPYFRKALAAQQEIFDGDRANLGEQNSLADCFIELAMALAKAGKPDEAIEANEKAIKNYQAFAQADAQNFSARRQIFYSRRQLADTLFQKGETGRALENYETALAGFKQLIVQDPNNTEWQHDFVLCHLRFGEVFLKKRDKLNAAPHFENALPIVEKLVAQSPENARWRADLETLRKYISDLKIDG